MKKSKLNDKQAAISDVALSPDITEKHVPEQQEPLVNTSIGRDNKTHMQGLSDFRVANVATNQIDRALTKKFGEDLALNDDQKTIMREAVEHMLGWMRQKNVPYWGVAMAIVFMPLVTMVLSKLATIAWNAFKAKKELSDAAKETPRAQNVG